MRKILLCNVKFSLLGLFLPQHAACQCLLFIFVFTFAFASVLELVWGYITVQAGRPREGIWRIGWFAGVERTREPLLYCTVLAAVPGRRPRRAHIHLGPDNSLRIGLLPDASSHIPWTFGFLGFHWRHQGHCGVTSGHLEWTD